MTFERPELKSGTVIAMGLGHIDDEYVPSLNLYKLGVLFLVSVKIFYSLTADDKPVNGYWLAEYFRDLGQKNPDQQCNSGYGTFDALVSQHKGLSYQSYQAITQDNYILKLFRVYPENTNLRTYKPAKGVA
jgi:pimeloyl-ACP methyl ester carboxylesterase